VSDAVDPADTANWLIAPSLGFDAAKNKWENANPDAARAPADSKERRIYECLQAMQGFGTTRLAYVTKSDELKVVPIDPLTSLTAHQRHHIYTYYIGDTFANPPAECHDRDFGR